MQYKFQFSKILLSLYASLILAVFYFPVFSTAVASLSEKRYFSFPYPTKDLTFRWYREALNSAQVRTYVFTSLKIAALTTILSLSIGFFAALAYARYSWGAQKFFHKLVLLPLFLPQSVIGLALLLWFNFLGIQPTWWTAAIAHTVWIAPIATLIIAIQAYSLDHSLEEAAADLGASQFLILLRITLPLLKPAIISAGCFCVLLSWGNFALSLYTTGADSTLPEWLYARMTSGYQPIIPAIGVLSVFVAILAVTLTFAILARAKNKVKV
ncbi:MAG: ABC transporter permease [Chthoniobacterales bacterium]|nr:ABC transporter permease [Chthoniobacterales bacterium]